MHNEVWGCAEIMPNIQMKTFFYQIQYFIQRLFSKFNDFIQIYSKKTFAKMLSIVIILIKFSRTIHLIDMSTILKW